MPDTAHAVLRPGLVIRLHPADDVAIARVELPAGTPIAGGASAGIAASSSGVRAQTTIPAGHKVAMRDVAQGRPVKR
jgi:altronate hydrolase